MKDDQFHNILEQLYDTPWMILPETLELICSIVDRKMQGEKLSDAQLNEITGGRKPSNTTLEMPENPSVAVLPIQGPIFPKANLMTQMSGATSLGQIKSQFNSLMENDMVTGIVLDIDSPGGHASMIKEFADTIWEARQSGAKPISAVANPLCCSAAYYLGSQAERFYATPSALVGNIGVIAEHIDTSAKDKEEGIVRTTLKVGKYKDEGSPHKPLGDEAKEFKLSQMQELYDEFIDDVARGRGVSPELVATEFGQGRYYRAKTAEKRGMVDGVKTIDSLVSEMTNESSGFSISMNTNKGDEKMEGITPETLTLLGLAEDATDVDIQTAVAELAARPIAVLDTTTSVDADFAAMFPEQAKALADLNQTNRVNAAKLFATEYSSFTGEDAKTGYGFSALGLGRIEELHLKISDGLMSHGDFKEFLDFVASKNSVVHYGEIGSTRGEDLTSTDGESAAVQLKAKADAYALENNASYGDALSHVMNENPALAQSYRSSVASPVERGEG